VRRDQTKVKLDAVPVDVDLLVGARASLPYANARSSVATSDSACSANASLPKLSASAARRDAVGGGAHRQFTQGSEIALAEEVLQSASDLVAHVDLALV
jgi:hypothetical protein